MVRKILQPVFTAWAVLTFVTGLLITFPCYLIFSISNNAAGRRKIFRVVKCWAVCWLWINGMPLRKRGTLPPRGRYIIVANHISYLDSIVLFPAMPDYFRPLGKKEFSRVPVLGFLYRQLAIMVDRDSAQSRTASMRRMRRVLTEEADILIFPEGTFNETGGPLKSFYNGAFRLALVTQTPILPVIFPDTLQRWHYSAWWKLWPGRNRAIYLEPVQVAGMTINDLTALKDKVHALMSAAVAAYRS